MAIVYSLIDPAGKGIAKYVLNGLGGREIKLPRAKEAWMLEEGNAVLAGFTDDVIYFDFLDTVFESLSVDYYLVLSRHSAKSGIKSLTVHHTGNFTSSALVGGRPYELSIANPPVTKQLLKGLLRARDEYGLEDFEVTYEVTHHGPTGLKKPLTFVEIGSSSEEWSLSKAHEAVGSVVVDVLSKDVEACRSVVGVGGPHYAGIFTKRALSSDECYGHIIPKYALNELKQDPNKLLEMVKKAVTMTSQPTEAIVTLKKVGKVVKEVVSDVAKEFGIEVIITSK